MNRKFIILSLYFFSTICLFSVGFSSWTICMGDKLTASGNIVAEDVFNHNQYIEHVSTTPFSYFNTGFVEYDENDIPSITNVGSITFKYNLNLTNCYTKYKDEGSAVAINFKLGYNGTPNWTKINGQDPLINSTLTANINGVSYDWSETSNPADLTYIVEISKEQTGFLPIEITYTFTYPKAPGTDPNETNYNVCEGFEEIASCFRDDNIMFSLEVGISATSTSGN